jgi:hypothetical protein
VIDAIPSAGSSTRDAIVGRALLNAEAVKGLQGSELAGTTAVTPFWDAGITGAGQVVGVGDSGVDRANCYLSGADKFVLVRAWQNDVDENGHGTHVCGSVAGYSATSGADAEGTAYDSKMAFTDLGNSGGGVANPDSMGDDFYEHAREVGARIHTDSWGSLTHDAVLGGESAYITPTQEVDAYAATNMDFLPMFAVANAGPSVSTYASPANGKNALAIGATLSPNTEHVYPSDNDGLFCGSDCAKSGSGWFSLLTQLRLELGHAGLAVYALDIGGPDAAHWAHLSGEIRAISSVTKVSSPASGDHAFAAAVAIVTSPSDACAALSNDVSGKVAVAYLSSSCGISDRVTRLAAAGAAAVVLVNDEAVTAISFPSYSSVASGTRFVPVGDV